MPARNSGQARTVWIVFDEWDQRLAFSARHAGLRLPEIDRFRSQALYASNAYPSAIGTAWSVPAMLTGERARNAAMVGAEDMVFEVPRRKGPVRLKGYPNVFSAARRTGATTGVVGWALPYCPILGADLTVCEWWGYSRNKLLGWGDTFGAIMPNQIRSLFETYDHSPFGQPLTTRHHARVYREMLAAAENMCADGTMDLVFLHLPVPHGPFFYSRATGRDDRGAAPVLGMFFEQDIRGYIDALALVDLTLGKLRRRMEEAGLWDNTAVLLSADHPLREARKLDGVFSQNVPFLLKMPGQREGISYTEPFNTSLAHDLVLAVLAGQVADGPAVMRWLDAHRRDTPFTPLPE